MIKILATSDWHLGNTAFGLERRDEFINYMQWLFDVIKERQPDVLLVAGDVFDNSNPSSEAQKLYYDFITKLVKDCQGMQTIIIAGNHDSAGRLEAPRDLLGLMNVHIRGYIKRNDGKPDYDDLIIPVMSRDGKDKAWVLAVPYLRDGDYERLEDCYSKNVKGFISKMIDVASGQRQENEALILMAHLYCRNADIAKNNEQSERIVVGGAEQVDIADLNKDIDLTVLGHIHKRQTVDGNPNMRYIGSALPMSFAEKYYKHGTELFTFENGHLNTDDIVFDEYHPLHRLITIPDNTNAGMEQEDVINKINELPEESYGHEPLLKVVVNLTTPDVSLQNDINNALTGKNIFLCGTQVHFPESKSDDNAASLVSFDKLKQEPMDMLKKIFKANSKGGEMDERLMALAQKAIDAVKEDCNDKEE
jgi:exonuclease SbcD